MLPLILSVLCSSCLLAIPVDDRTDQVRQISFQSSLDDSQLKIQFTAFDREFSLKLTEISSLSPPSFIEDGSEESPHLENEEPPRLFQDELSDTSLIVTRTGNETKLDGIIAGDYKIVSHENYHIISILAKDNESLVHDYAMIEDIPKEEEEEEIISKLHSDARDPSGGGWKALLKVGPQRLGHQHLREELLERGQPPFQVGDIAPDRTEHRRQVLSRKVKFDRIPNIYRIYSGFENV